MIKSRKIIFSMLFLILLIPISNISFVRDFCVNLLPDCENNLANNIYISLVRIIIVFLVASICGTFIGIVLYRYKYSAPIMFLIDFLRSIPAIVLFTLLVIAWSYTSHKILWVLSLNFAIWPVVLSVCTSLKTLKQETVFSIKQLDLPVNLKYLYIWFPIIWERSKDSGYKISISNSILSVITMEFLLGGGSCNLCIENSFFSVPGIGGVFGAIDAHSTSMLQNLPVLIIVFIIIGLIGVIINLQFIEFLDATYKKFLHKR